MTQHKTDHLNVTADTSKNTERLSLYQRINKWLVDQFETEPSRLASKHQFEPAAVELESTPPNQLARSVSIAVILLFSIAVVWACIGKIDVVAVAQGQIVPSERVKDIQPLSLGAISAIYVKEGQQVEAGELLLELDATITNADSEQVRHQLLNQQSQYLQARYFQQFLELPKETDNTELPELLDRFRAEYTSSLPVLENKKLDFATWNLEQDLRNYLSSYEALRYELLARLSEAEMTAVNLAAAEEILPIVKERMSAMEQLEQRNLASRSQYLELKQEYIEQARTLASNQQQYQQLKNEVAQLRSQLETLRTSQLAALAEEQNSLLLAIDDLEQDIARVDERDRQMQLRAPISGTVQNLTVYTLGGVVQAAQVLMQIIPTNAHLEVEAWVENKDIGFVDAGQFAEVKVDSFQFTKYGVINASIEMLSEDAVNDEQQGPIYRALVSLENDWMQIDNKKVRLTPGMSVSVEVKTDQRRLIEYFLSPLLRYKQESIRER